MIVRDPSNLVNCIAELLDRGSITILKEKDPTTGKQIAVVMVKFPNERFVRLQTMYERSGIAIDELPIILSEMIFQMREVIERGAARPQGPTS